MHTECTLLFFLVIVNVICNEFVFKYFHIFLPGFTFLEWLQLSKNTCHCTTEKRVCFLFLFFCFCLFVCFSFSFLLLLLLLWGVGVGIVRKMYLLLRVWSFNSSKPNLSNNLDGGKDLLNFHTLGFRHETLNFKYYDCSKAFSS